MTPDTFGSRVRAARLAQQLSVKQLAERIGVSRQLLDYWERGRSIPAVTRAWLLADALQVPLDTLRPTS